jgi:poly-gamma-glutamate capsule biosynthesis protein CapA/YwtB (metallophosphatase superfamily)
MKRKIAFIVLLLLIVFGVVYFKNLNNQQQPTIDFVNIEKEIPQEEEVSLIAVGDISFSRGVEKTVKEQNDVNYPFLKIRDYLNGGDLVFGNLETPITPGREISNYEMIFRSNPDTAQALQEAGFSVLSLANNHTPNFGEKGLKDTFEYLDSVGIKYVGAGQNDQQANHPLYINKKGIDFAFLAYNDPDVVPVTYEASATRWGTAFMREQTMAEAVVEAKQNADFVIVSMHSGTEYVENPNNSQVNFAHAAIDAGADLVIGHHPHVVQTMEEYKGKYIFYSLGNFVFDQMWWKETERGLIAKIFFTKNGITKISLLPTEMENFTQPRMASESEAGEILNRLKFPLDNRVVYSWNGENNSFEKTFRKTIYIQDHKADISSKKEQADLNNNSIEETYYLENGRLTITENEKSIWQSPNKMTSDFKIIDIDNDGNDDLIAMGVDGYITVWKWKDNSFLNQWRSEEKGFSNFDIERIEGKNYIVVDSNL